MKKIEFRYILLYLLVVIAGACSQKDQLFVKLDSNQTGIEFQNELTETDDFNILDYLYFYNGGGIAVGDINQDGLPDIYISGNQMKNKLYLNKGDFNFEDITESAGVAGDSDWNTGAVIGDVNGDGLLDIYVCAVVGIRGTDGYNELFINNGDNTFSEQAGKYGLDFDSYSSTAAFLDYDLDGDLDIYLLNHAIHTQESFGHANLRLKRTYETGDKLLRNDGDSFEDVSEEAGIFGGVNGYGLGISIADFNQDGYPDIYVGNDFHEDDYFYINNGNGTFTENLKGHFGQTTRFSMGNDVADINSDGMPDLISLDMLPENEEVLKTSEGDEDFNILRLRTNQYGYHYQFSRNMLQINQGDGFVEAALLNGVAATDWSWSALFADYDQDGNQDLFISNGIPKRPNDLDYIRFVSNDQIKNKIDATKLVDQQALDMMPSGEAQNYLFVGSESGFDNISDQIPQETLFSTATAMGDLDNDGDVDLIVYNNNAKVSIYKNTIGAQSNYLKLKFEYTEKNRFGIGAKVYIYHDDRLQFKELFTARGFQSSSEPMIHFGLGNTSIVDSVRIVWPDQTTQLLTQVNAGQTLVIQRSDDAISYRVSAGVRKKLFEKVEDNLGINFNHREDRYIDFDRQKLIPYQVSDRGPATALGDLNNDGLIDVFFGGSKFLPSAIYLQTSTGFDLTNISSVQKDSVIEEVAASIADFNGDGLNDLLIGTGGADFYGTMKPLLDKYLVQSQTGFADSFLPESFENASVVAPFDFDGDGDLDVFIGNQAVSSDFGAVPFSMLLINEGGKFSIQENEDLSRVGMVTDAVWNDYDQDGASDLIVVGEWMSPKFFKNIEGSLILQEVMDRDVSGLWQSIEPIDIDTDGDTDFVVGNWGLNSKFTASEKYPLKMYYGDLDQNGNTETLIATAKNGKYYPFESLDELAKQMVSLRKTYTDYKGFAGETIDQVIRLNNLQIEELFTVNTLQSGVLRNDQGNYVFISLPLELQLSPIMTLEAYDFDQDGNQEVLAGGNYFGLKPIHGRLGSFSGALINGVEDVIPGNVLGLDLLNQSVRDLNLIQKGSETYLLVTINNAEAQVYKIIK